MFTFIEKLQNQPVQKRRRFAFVAAGVITLIIFGVWVTTLSFKTSTDETIGRPDVGPLDSIVRGFSELFD